MRSCCDRLKRLGVESWSPWSCEKSSFDWSYDGTETCYFKQGRVTVETADGKVDVGEGDLVQFADGLSCKWVVHEPVRKVYSFDPVKLDE